MYDIDFLPSDYVCVRTTRHSNNWLRGLFAIVLGSMIVGWMAQRNSLNALIARRNRMQEQTNALQAKLGSAEHFRRELEQLESDARLLDVLRLNASPSRWLSAVALALPSQVVLHDVRATVEELAEPSTRSAPNRSSPKPVEEPVGNPVQRDLDRLAKSAERQVLTISLNGTAPDDLAVSSFLNALQRTTLFDRVQLLFTDQHGQGEHSLRTFAVRLRARPIPRRIPGSRAESGNARPPAVTRTLQSNAFR